MLKRFLIFMIKGILKGAFLGFILFLFALKIEQYKIIPYLLNK